MKGESADIWMRGMATGNRFGLGFASLYLSVNHFIDGHKLSGWICLALASYFAIRVIYGISWIRQNC